MVENAAYEKLIGVIIGNYRLEKLREKHKWGPVFLGQTKAGERYDIRFLDVPGRENVSERSADAHIVYLGRFQQEANRVAALRHPNILTLLDYGSYQGMPYLVYPAMSLVSLRNLLAQSVPHDYLVIGRYLEQIASALEYAHSQAVIHRSLASDNIFMPNGKQLLVGGFGLLRMRELIRQDSLAGGANQAQGSASEGSSESTAPEQLLGKSIDAYADIYALGAVLYRLLTGQPPFTGQSREEVARQHIYAEVPSLRKWRADLPAGLYTVVARAMAKEPLQRFHHPGELVYAYYRVTAPQELPRLASVFSPPISGQLPGAGGERERVQTGVMAAQYDEPRRSGSLVSRSSMKMQAQNAPVSRRRLMRILAVSGGVGVIALAAIYGQHFLQAPVANSRAAQNGSTAATIQKPKTGQNSTAGKITNTAATPNAPAHQGTVLARTTDLPVNSAKTFPLANSPHPGVLIHLPDNRFVAFDSTCTHAQCAVSYNQTNSLLECPCHGAVFNPAKNAAVVQGPAPTPLATVKIVVNTDGTITTG
jgi:serine/threonine protein kinase